MVLRATESLANVGMPIEHYSFRLGLLIDGNKVFTGSRSGHRAAPGDARLLHRARAGATVESLDASDTITINQADDAVVAGWVRYRCVIDTSAIGRSLVARLSRSRESA